jgi:Domain of unknown function (DUF5103)
MRYLIFILAIFTTTAAPAQLADHIYKSNIKSVKLHKPGDPYSYPILRLNSVDDLDLYFDDMDANIKNYYYTFQLCNADWMPVNLHPFDYIKGFQTNRITTYRNSTIAFTRYTNYYARIPDKNCSPTRSGNYLLKVFLDSDTSKLVFTKRFLVVDVKSSIGGQVVQPFGGSIFRTHQKVQVSVNLNSQLNAFSQQDVKVVLLQNFAWPSAVYLQRPSILRGNYFEYNDEGTNSFPAGKEWRWIDLRSNRLMSERMQRLDKQPTRTDVYIKPDSERSQQIYYYYRDINGFYTIETTDKVNPFWQSDYSYVHFTFFPPNNQQYAGKDIYLYGEFTNYAISNDTKMEFNNDKGAYEKTMLLKQGFYNYSYVTVNAKKPEEKPAIESTEGNYPSTENVYLVLVYYRGFGARADELIGYTTINSLLERP